MPSSPGKANQLTVPLIVEGLQKSPSLTVPNTLCKSPNRKTPLKSPCKDDQGCTLKEREERARAAKIALYVAANPPSYVLDVCEKCLPIWEKFLEGLSIVIPYIISAVSFIVTWYRTLPVEIVKGSYGLALCFFGGHYLVAIAAIEAFKHSGGETITAALKDLYDEYVYLCDKNVEDDEEDLDNDGIADVLQIDKRDLMQRKMNLIFSNLNPDKLTSAIWGLYQGFLAVLMTVKFQFAQTVALAVSMAETSRPIVATMLVPILSRALPPDCEDWASAFVNYLCKTIALTLAWTLQKMLCAVQSAMQGGHIFSSNLIVFLSTKAGIEIDLDKTMFDEYVGWGMAAIGVYFQLTSLVATSFPFPFNILLMPLDFVEFVLEYTVTYLT